VWVQVAFDIVCYDVKNLLTVREFTLMGNRYIISDYQKPCIMERTGKMKRYLTDAFPKWVFLSVLAFFQIAFLMPILTPCIGKELQIPDSRYLDSRTPIRVKQVDIIRGVTPWGDIVFLDDRTLIVPYAHTRELTPEELERERKKAYQFLNRPTEEIVDELVKPEQGEAHAINAFRRWLAERYIEYLKANPEAQRIEGEYVEELGIRFFSISREGIREVKSIPLWQGLGRVQTNVYYIGGLGTGQRLELHRVNLHVGVRVGKDIISVWTSHPEQPDNTTTVFLSKNTLEVLGYTSGFIPLEWIDRENVFALKHSPNNKWIAGIYKVLPTSDKLLIPVKVLNVGLSPRPSFTGEIVKIPANRTQSFLAVIHNGKISLLDTTTEAISPLYLQDFFKGKRYLKASANSGLQTFNRRVWTVGLAGNWVVAGIGETTEGIKVDYVYELPKTGEPPGHWGGPLATTSGYLILAFDPMLWREKEKGVYGGSSSHLVELWAFDPRTKYLSRIEGTGRIPYRRGYRVVATSPGGRLLAARTGDDEVKIWELNPL